MQIVCDYAARAAVHIEPLVFGGVFVNAGLVGRIEDVGHRNVGEYKVQILGIQTLIQRLPVRRGQCRAEESIGTS